MMRSFLAPSLRRASCALVASLMLANLVFVNAALASEHARARRPGNVPIEAVTPLDFDLPTADDPMFTDPVDTWGPAIEAAAGSEAPSACPRAPEGSESKGLWARLKDFIKEDWRQTKEDMRAIGHWFAKPIKNFKYAWRRLREKVRSFRKRLMRAGKLAVLAMMGRELDQEEDMVHTLLTGYIDQYGVEKLLDVLSNSNNSELEQVALLARKVDDPVLQSQMLQRYVAREFLRMRKKAEQADPDEVAKVLERIEEGAAALETQDPNPQEWIGHPDEAPAAPVYTPYYPYKPTRDGKKSLSMRKILIGLIAGAGLVLSAYFAFTTMTIAPFLAFLSTVVSLLAMLRDDFQFGQRVVIMPPPHPGPWPTQPPTQEPPPIDPGNAGPVDDGGDGGSTPPPADPAPQDPGPQDPGGAPPWERDDADEFPMVNVNQAGEDELQNLPGVGPTIARRILAARAQGGEFQGPKDLQTRVKGLGAKKVAVLELYLEF